MESKIRFITSVGKCQRGSLWSNLLCRHAHNSAAGLYISQYNSASPDNGALANLDARQHNRTQSHMGIRAHSDPTPQCHAGGQMCVIAHYAIVFHDAACIHNAVPPYHGVRIDHRAWHHQGARTNAAAGRDSGRWVNDRGRVKFMR